jgi:hypothetical protein
VLRLSPLYVWLQSCSLAESTNFAKFRIKHCVLLSSFRELWWSFIHGQIHRHEPIFENIWTMILSRNLEGRWFWNLLFPNVKPSWTKVWFVIAFRRFSIFNFVNILEYFFRIYVVILPLLWWRKTSLISSIVLSTCILTPVNQHHQYRILLFLLLLLLGWDWVPRYLLKSLGI